MPLKHTLVGVALALELLAREEFDDTVHSEIFAVFIFREKFRENKILAKWRNLFVVY